MVEVVGGAGQGDPAAEPSSATPESVREVVSQRLSRLAPKTTDLLELAAVAGPEFELEPIRRAAGLTEPELLAALEEAVGSGMIEELPSQRLACRFTHEIVRRALYDRLSRLRRAELHLRVGGGARARRRAPPTARSRTSPITSARRPRSAGPSGRSTTTCARRGAASAALAFDDAATRLRTAIEIGIEDEAERADALLELGSASHRAGKATDAQEAFAAAAEIARGLESAELLARAAIGYEEACWRPGIASRDAIELLEEALTAVGERKRRAADRPAGRARPRARLRRASASAGRSCAKTRSRWRGSHGDRTGAGARCWSAPTGRAARPRSRRSWRC